ncbi:Fc.00g015100.m01.CDS01 [Cosmosporella sp. VM-42]
MAQRQPQLQNATETATTPPPIPPLGSIAPAIFVPIAEDLTAPLPPFPSRSARLRAILADIDTQAAAVQSNILTLHAREHARVIQKSADDNVSFKANGFQDITLGLEPHDQAAMIANMETPHDPNVDYNITNIVKLDLTGLVGTTPRQWAALEVMRNAENARDSMEKYEVQVNQAKEVYEVALRKALAEEAE